MGTALLGILCGHWRYAHINSVRGDTVNAGLLGMDRIVSEDVVRTFRTAMQVGWQMEANWTDPVLFFIYSVAKPVSAALRIPVRPRQARKTSVMGELYQSKGRRGPLR